MQSVGRADLHTRYAYVDAVPFLNVQVECRDFLDIQPKLTTYDLSACVFQAREYRLCAMAMAGLLLSRTDWLLLAASDRFCGNARLRRAFAISRLEGK